MKKIIFMMAGFFAMNVASAQTDTINTIRQETLIDNTTTIQKNDGLTKKNPDGTKKVRKTYEGNNKPNTNAIRNNTTGSPDKVRNPTDTTATPSGTMNPGRPKAGNTTKTTVPNGSSTLPNTGTTPRK